MGIVQAAGDHDAGREPADQPMPRTGSTVVVDDADDGARVRPTPGRRRVNRELLLVSLALSIGLVLIGIGVLRSVTGDEVTNLPDAIEEISPTPDAQQVLQQTDVVVDLAEGYEGELTIDGLALPTIRLDELPTLNAEPGEQIEIPPGVIFEPGNGTLRFRPAEGAGIESFEPGAHSVVVTYWRTEEGRDAARSHGWTFVVI